MSLRTDPMLIVGLALLLSQGTSGIAPKENRGPDAPSFKLVSIDKGDPTPRIPGPLSGSARPPAIPRFSGLVFMCWPSPLRSGQVFIRASSHVHWLPPPGPATFDLKH